MSNGWLKKEISWGGVNLTQKALFAKHLSVMLGAGLTLTEALAVSIDSATGALRRTLTRVERSVESGSSFAEALTVFPRIFSGIFVSAVYAGERSGNLATNLANLARELEKERNLLSKVRGAMIYPAIVLVSTIGLGLTIAFFILPKITPLFRGLKIDLPFTTRWLIWLADFVDRRGLIFLVGFIVVVAFLRWLLHQGFMAPLTHWLILRSPGSGRLASNLNLARTASSLGLLLKSGINIDEALTITEKTLNNFYYRRALREVTSEVGRGLKLSDGLERFPKLFPRLFARMVRVGEVSGRFEDTFFYLADFYEDEVDATTKSLSTILEPILLLLIGFVVAGLALSIITPIYQITGNIRR